MLRFRSVRRQRSAFSLVELVVVLCLIAVLIGMLLPAVQKVRESANRMQCVNNLKQIGEGFHEYQAGQGHYPGGGSHLPPAYPTSAPPHRREFWSWAYHLLPFVDQETLHRNPTSTVICQAPVKTYYCPSRRRAGLYQGQARIDYAGNAGTDPEGRNGVVVRYGFGRCAPGHLLDGKAHTLLAAEKQLNSAGLGTSSDDDEAYVLPGWDGDMDVYRFGLETPARDFRAPASLAPSQRFGSAHAMGLNAVFADGSVRQIRYSVGAVAFRMACVRDDGTFYNPDGP